MINILLLLGIVSYCGYFATITVWSQFVSENFPWLDSSLLLLGTILNLCYICCWCKKRTTKMTDHAETARITDARSTDDDRHV